MTELQAVELIAHVQVLTWWVVFGVGLLLGMQLYRVAFGSANADVTEF
jgi:hypothetical protein